MELIEFGFCSFCGVFPSFLDWRPWRLLSPASHGMGVGFCMHQRHDKKKMETKKVFVGDVTHMPPIAHYEFDLVPFFVRKELRLMATAKTQNLKTTCIHACSRAFALPINLSVRSLLSE